MEAAMRAAAAPIIANRMTNAPRIPQNNTLCCQAGGTAK